MKSRSYYCQGQRPEVVTENGKAVKKPGCSCTNLDAAEVEEAVWNKVAELLRDEGRLTVLADRRVKIFPATGTNMPSESRASRRASKNRSN